MLAFGVGVEGALDGFAAGAPAGLRLTAPLTTEDHIPLGGAPEPRMPTWEELARGGAA